YSIASTTVLQRTGFAMSIAEPKTGLAQNAADHCGGERVVQRLRVGIEPDSHTVDTVAVVDQEFADPDSDRLGDQGAGLCSLAHARCEGFGAVEPVHRNTTG